MLLQWTLALRCHITIVAYTHIPGVLFLQCLAIVMMAPSRSRSVSRGQNEDSVKRDRLSKSADRNKSATRSRSKSVPKSKSRSRSKPAVNKRRSRSRKRSTSRRRRSGSRRRSRSRSRGGRNSGQKFRSRSPRGRSPGADDGYRLHVAGNIYHILEYYIHVQHITNQ